MLESKQRLILQPDIQSWVSQALAPVGIEVVPITPEAALLATRLPGQFHGDPADRIIAATAQLLNVSLVTADGKIIEYARSGHLKAFAL